MSNQKFTFGPIPSRRFGISLGIDLSPSSKQCNFDCLYCELKPAKTISTMTDFPESNEVIEEIKDTFSKHPKIDVITVTANGEPTLYPKLDELISKINEIKKDTKTLILSNGSTIYKDEVFNALLKFDTVKLSLDCVSEKCFKKLDRVDKSIELEKIVDAMAEFKNRTTNFFVLEVLFVEGLNDNDSELELLYEAILKINPHRVDIGTIDRPPAYDVKGVDFSFLEYVAKKFTGINTNIVFKNRPKQINSYSENEILSMLERRPLTNEDIENMFDKNSKELLEKLLKNNQIKLVNSAGLNFYKIC